MAELYDAKLKAVNLELIARLETLLSMARSGDLKSFAAVGILHDGDWTTAWLCENRPLNLIGGLSILSRELQDHEIDLRLHNAGFRYD